MLKEKFGTVKEGKQQNIWQKIKDALKKTDILYLYWVIIISTKTFFVLLVIFASMIKVEAYRLSVILYGLSLLELY